MEWLKALRPSGDHLTPREIVAELDKYIVGSNSRARLTRRLMMRKTHPTFRRRHYG